MAKNRAQRRRNEKGSPSSGFGLANLSSKFKAFRGGKSPIFNFFIKFLGVLLPFYVVWHTDFFKETILASWTALNSSMASVILNLFGASTTSVGNMLSGPGASLQIYEGCDGIEPVMLLVAGIVAFPAPVKHKLKGILYGSLFILGLNFVRILSLYVVQVYWPAGFEFMHIEFWQVVFILVAVLVWVFWIKKSIPQAAVENEKDSEQPD